MPDSEAHLLTTVVYLTHQLRIWGLPHFTYEKLSLSLGEYRRTGA